MTLNYWEPPDKYASEDELQVQCVQWAWRSYPHLRQTLWHTNQKAKNEIEGDFMRQMGTVPGIPDLQLMLQNGKTCYIEMKTDKGVLSDFQLAFQARCKNWGHTYLVVRSFKQFKFLYLLLTKQVEREPGSTFEWDGNDLFTYAQTKHDATKQKRKRNK